MSQCGGAAPGVVTGGALPGEPVQRANTRIVTSSWGEDKGKVRTDNASCGARMRAPRAASRAERLRPIYRANPIAPCGMPVAPDAAVTSDKGAMSNERQIARTRFQISDGVRASISHDGLVLLDLRGGVMLASNSIGARIWQLVESHLDCFEIANGVARDYDLSIERAQHDVTTFLAALEARGLVRPEPAC